jgi:hypothetical protein
VIRENFKKLLRGGLICLPLILIILPADFFDEGQSLCLSVLFFDTTCYGCGITRAIQHLIHLDFAEASHFNKMSFVVLPLLIGLWFKELRMIIKKIENKND